MQSQARLRNSGAAAARIVVYDFETPIKPFVIPQTVEQASKRRGGTDRRDLCVKASNAVLLLSQS
jgi:hypothetical protein